jgi:SM-20-related protein
VAVPQLRGCAAQSNGVSVLSAPDLDLDAFAKAPLSRDPFDHLVLPQFIRRESFDAINEDYPKITQRGSFPVDRVAYGPAFARLLDQLESDEFRAAFERKFSIDLTGRPSTITLRGCCGPGDGRIHTDSLSKIITILIYMNSSWENPGGRLRLLRSSNDISDIILEVPPSAGTLVAFKRASNSWHGHQPFIGERRVIQFNWVTTEGNQKLAMLRHHVSASVKRVLGFLQATSH